MKYLTKSILKMKKRNANHDVHKGFFGKTLVIGGEENFVGAPAMAANAAVAVLRSGADLVVVAAPAKVSWQINRLSPDVITKKITGKHFKKSHAKRIINMVMAEEFDCVLIGPGLGRNKDTLAFVRAITKQIKKPKVIDADALKAIRIQDVHDSILTPHKKEFEILLKNSKLNDSNFRKMLGNNVILIKGPVDKIISKHNIAYNNTGNSVMTKAGTGDVLAGLCAGFYCQTGDLFRSACMAAYLNGKTGDYLLKKKGRTFIASDIIDNLHKVFR